MYTTLHGWPDFPSVYVAEPLQCLLLLNVSCILFLINLVLCLKVNIFINVFGNNFPLLILRLF